MSKESLAQSADSIEIPMAQGWTRQLRLKFLNSHDSQLRLQQTNPPLLRLKQVHGAHFVSPPSPQKIPLWQPAQADGWCLSRAELEDLGKAELSVSTADCMPLAYVDHCNQKIALVHAGWRGLAQGIHKKPFLEGGFEPSSTWLWVGPHIHPSSYPVGEELKESFAEYRGNEKIFRAYTAPTSSKDAAQSPFAFSMLDFLEAELEPMGIELIYDVGIDTFSNSAWASYRREGPKSGLRLLSSLSWKSL